MAADSDHDSDEGFQAGFDGFEDAALEDDTDVHRNMDETHEARLDKARKMLRTREDFTRESNFDAFFQEFDDMAGKPASKGAGNLLHVLVEVVKHNELKPERVEPLVRRLVKECPELLEHTNKHDQNPIFTAITLCQDRLIDYMVSPLRQEAINIGQVDYLTKIHAEVEGDLRGLRGCTWPGDMLYVYGDGFCAGGKSTRITSFAGDNRGKLDPLKEPERLETALKRFHPMDIKKVVFHDWVSDPYAKAGAAWYPAGFLTKYLAELQTRHGNVFMANADWANRWRSFIEGAMEQGALAADQVLNELGILGANPAPGEYQRPSRL